MHVYFDSGSKEEERSVIISVILMKGITCFKELRKKA